MTFDAPESWRWRHGERYRGGGCSATCSSLQCLRRACGAGNRVGRGQAVASGKRALIGRCCPYARRRRGYGCILPYPLRWRAPETCPSHSRCGSGQDSRSACVSDFSRFARAIGVIGKFSAKQKHVRARCPRTLPYSPARPGRSIWSVGTPSSRSKRFTATNAGFRRGW